MKREITIPQVGWRYVKTSPSKNDVRTPFTILEVFADEKRCKAKHDGSTRVTSIRFDTLWYYTRVKDEPSVSDPEKPDAAASLAHIIACAVRVAIDEHERKCHGPQLKLVAEGK